MKHLEIELKTLLKKEDYIKLKEYFSDITPITQNNYYIDTCDYKLRSNKIAMRIRTFEDSAELTIKIPQDVGNMEYNQELSLEEAGNAIDQALIPDGLVLQELKNRGIQIIDWLVLGCLTTVRYEKETDIGLMALDESLYFDVTDYELELEVADEAKGTIDFIAFLEKNHIEYQKAASKLVRFIEKSKKD